MEVSPELLAPAEQRSGVSHQNKIMVSAIIPARNEEASIARAVESVAAQPEIAEVIVVDDQSTDRTAAILAELAARIPKLKILHTARAAARLDRQKLRRRAGRRCRTRRLAALHRCRHMPHARFHASRAHGCSGAQRCAGFLFPEQELGSFWERALIPFIYCRLSAKFSYVQVNNPKVLRPQPTANS